MIKKGLLLLAIITSPAVCALDLHSETQEIQALRARSAPRASFHYCMAGTLTCRTLVLLKDQSGQKLTEFYDNFFSSERAVSATGYFLLNGDGTYRNYLDETFDGQVNINLIHDENRRVKVTFDSQGFPTMHKLVLKHMGSSKFAVADLRYGPEETVIEGFQYDSKDPNFKVPIRVVYRRLYGAVVSASYNSL